MKLKNTVLAALSCALLVSACTDKQDDTQPATATPLIDPATGWTTVGTIPFRGLVTGLPGTHAMTPYDLAVVDNDLALLYSEDYQLSGVQATKSYKVRFAPGSPIPESTPLQRGGWAFSYLSRFVPGSFTPVYMKMEGANYTCLTYSDEAGPLGGGNTDYTTPAIRPINWYANGGLTMTVPGGAKQAYVLSYTFPETGNFKVAENVWRQDSTAWRGYDAMQFANGEVDQFLVSVKGAKVYFSVLKNDPNFVSTTGMTPSFSTLIRQEMPGLNAAGFGISNMIIASQVVNDRYTVLIGEHAAGNSSIFTKVHCYQWQKGAAQFTRVYGDIALPADIGQNFMSRATIGTRPVEGSGASVKFTPDATAYMLYSGSPSNYVQNDKYTALAIVNAQGAQMVGKYASPTQYEQIDLGVCHYLNGAYYAVVYQKREQLFDKSDARFRLDIVKLKL